MNSDNSDNGSVVESLERKSLPNYSTDRAYKAIEDVYLENDSAVESFIEPVSEFDKGKYDGKEPVSELDRKFDELLERHSGSAEDPVRGYELANEVVTADNYPEAHDALRDFHSWTDEELDGMLRNTGVVFQDIGSLEDDEYKEAIKFHSLRRVVQHNYNHEPPENPAVFEPST